MQNENLLLQNINFKFKASIMRFATFSCVFLLTLAATTAAPADFDVYPYSLGGKIVTGGHDDVLGLDNVTQRVFGYSFGEDPLDPYVIGDPGFNNGADGIGVYPGDGLLPTGKTLGFNVLSNLEYWDGTGSVAFTAAPAGVDLGITRGSSTVHISGTGITGTVPTIGSTGAAGRLHVHVQSTLNAADGISPALSNAPDGIYLLELQMTLADSALANSAPLYFVYNNALDDSAHDQAIDWVQSNLVPEPSALALLGMASVAVACRLCRKMRRGSD